MEYELSSEQKELSDKLVENYKKGIDSLVFAVCGSGKTEITINLIKYCISNGQHVGFAIPRREVAVELHMRFKSIFAKNKITLVCGGHHTNLVGDLIVLTTHQLFRYDHYFDLLIVDELDAFPYKGNPTLEAILNRSVKGNKVLMSATVTQKEIENFEINGGNVLTLFERFHKHALPVPKILRTNKFFLYVMLYRKVGQMIKRNQQVFIFTPTIGESEKVYKSLKIFFKHGECVNSKRDNKQTIIDFKNKKLSYLVTTAVLERGVTVPDLQVIVFKADHNIYDSASLIQISGRAGRKKEAPEGEVIFIATKVTKVMEDAIDSINTANANLQSMF